MKNHSELKKKKKFYDSVKHNNKIEKSLNDKLQRRRQERYKHGRSDNKFVEGGIKIPRAEEKNKIR